MALTSCPKCATTLRVPDGSTAAVRCPKCQTIFQPPQQIKPAFEVVDDSPPRPRPSAPSPPKVTLPKPPARRPAPITANEPDFEVIDDEPPKSRAKALSLDEDDDRPRSRRPRHDDDDRTPRKKPKRRNDYDDEEDEFDSRTPVASRKQHPLGIARVGLLLLLISLGLYAGSLALHCLFLFIAWVGGVIPNGLILTTGLLGLSNWVVALVGLGTTIAGPPRVRGLAIAATAVAAVHLVLAFVVANDTKSVFFSSHSIQMLSSMNRAERLSQLDKDLQKEMAKNPNGAAAKDLRDELASYRSNDRDESFVVVNGEGGKAAVRSPMRWGDLTTLLPVLDQLVAILSYQSKLFSDYLLGMFAGLAELARFILMAILIGSLAGAARVHRAADKAKFGWIGGSIASGACLLIVLLIAVILDSYASDFKRAVTFNVAPPNFGGSTNFQDIQRQQEDWQRQFHAESEKREEKFRSLQRGMKTWTALGELTVYALHAGMLVLPALAAYQIFAATGKRSS